MKTRQIFLFGIPFDTVSEDQALLKLHYYSQLPKGDQKICVTPNPEMLVEASKNPEFRKILHDADFSLADGTGIVWASGFLPLTKIEAPSFLQRQLKLRPEYCIKAICSLVQFVFARSKFTSQIRSSVTGVDIFGKFLATTEARVFLLGGLKGAAQKISESMPCVVGYFDEYISEATNDEVLDKIRQSRAEVVFVALGAPKQEIWISKNLKKLPDVRFCMGVGGAFDFISGMRKRAPRFVRKLGFEWLFRCIQEPWRIHRIWKATVVFFFLTVRQRSQK